MKVLFVAIISSKKFGLHIPEKFFWVAKKQGTFMISAQLLCSKQMGQLLDMCTKGGFKNFLAPSRPWRYNLM